MKQEYPPRRENSAKVLADAVQALRSHEADGAETLSEGSRSRVFQAVTEGDAVPPAWARLFTPWRRMALTGLAPLLLVVAVVGWLGLRVEGPRHDILQPIGVEVVKTGDEVVFNIANGGRDHFISTSERPDRFDGSTRAKVVDGTFADRLDRGSELVFYRID
jgi:hypothetical protein